MPTSIGKVVPLLAHRWLSFFLLPCFGVLVHCTSILPSFNPLLCYPSLMDDEQAEYLYIERV